MASTLQLAANTFQDILELQEQIKVAQSIINDSHTAEEDREHNLKQLTELQMDLASKTSILATMLPTTLATTPPEPPKATMWSQLHKDPSSVSPKHGGLFKEEDKDDIIPFVGYDPDAAVNIFTYDPKTKDWICLGDHHSSFPNQKGPNHVGQFRPMGVKATKLTKEDCVKLEEPISFNGLMSGTSSETQLKIRTYIALMRQAIITRGMYSEFMIPDAGNPKGCDIFQKHARFTLEQVQAHILQERQTADSYRLSNYLWSGQLIRSTLHPDLLSKVVQQVGVNSSGPEVWIATMKEVFSGEHFEQLDALKDQLKALKLSDFPGENIQEANEKVKDLMSQLDGADLLQVGDSLLLTQVGLYEQSSAEHMRLWAINEYRAVSQFVDQCRYCDPEKMSHIPQKDLITYETLAQRSNGMYKELLSRQWYPPAIKTKFSPEEAPITMLAQVSKHVTKNVLNELKKAGIKNNRPGPSMSKDTASSPDGDQSIKWNKLPPVFSDPKQWRSHFPSGWKKDKVFKYHGRKYKWCSKCNKWMFHNDAGHEKWTQKKGHKDHPSKSNATHSPGPVNTNLPTRTSPRASLAITGCVSQDSDTESHSSWAPYLV